MSIGRPLEGCRVIVTRGEEKTDRLPALLEEAGASVSRVPLIRTELLVGEADIREAVARLRSDDGPSPPAAWLVLTSENAATLVAAAAGTASLTGVSVAVVGPATAAAVRALGIEVELEAPAQEAESLASELVRHGVSGSRVLVIAAGGGRNVVAPVLARAGAQVEVIEGYRSVMPAGAAERLREELSRGPVAAISFTSGSTVRNAADALPEPPQQCVAACIGPITAEAARDAGWAQIVVASEHTAAGLVAALIGRLNHPHPLP